MKKISALFSLFLSSGTLICCAIPALLVALGFGATLAGLISAFPQLVWLSEQKVVIFVSAGILLALAVGIQYWNRNAYCPVGEARDACASTRDLSRYVLVLSLFIYLTGGIVTFILPYFI